MNSSLASSSSSSLQIFSSSAFAILLKSPVSCPSSSRLICLDIIVAKQDEAQLQETPVGELFAYLREMFAETISLVALVNRRIGFVSREAIKSIMTVPINSMTTVTFRYSENPMARSVKTPVTYREVGQALDESSILSFAFETAALNVPLKYSVLPDNIEFPETARRFYSS